MFQTPDTYAQGDYPANWDQLVGQTRAKQQLQLAAKSARLRHTPLDHTLIACGIPGVGKTAMALLTAAEMGSYMVPVSGAINANQARIILSDMDDGDILFWDEIHQAVQGGKGRAEWLLTYLQDGTIPGPRGNEEMPRVTVIGATTDVGKLPETIVSRFPLVPQVVNYTLDEATNIVAVLATKILPATVNAPTPSNCAQLATAANHNPRAIRRLLSTLRDLAVTETITFGAHGWPIVEVLEWHGVTPDGLDSTAQRYLRMLLTEFGGQAGERALMDRLQEPGGLGDVERVLCDKQLVTRTRGGRVITTTGIRRARDLDRAA